MPQGHCGCLRPIFGALPFRGVVAASAIAVTYLACVSLLTLLKSVLRSECPLPGGSSLRPVAIACVVAVMLCFVASVSYSVKSRSWSHAAAICSKWQPVYFVFLSVQRLILRAVIAYVVSTGTRPNGPCLEYESAVHAVFLMWTCAILTAGWLTMSCDLNAQLSPALRRCAYGLLAFVLLVDAIGSVVWGNPLASDFSIFISNINVLLDNQLTSCIASQVVIALHFVYVSCRSRRGRGWAYASLRFELDECGKSMAMAMVPTITGSRMEGGATAATPMLASDASARAQLQQAGAARWNVLSRLRQRWLQFQQRQVTQCRVFVVPCVAISGAAGGGEAGFALARPAFDFKCLLPLQQLADVHPRLYVGFCFSFLGLPSIMCSIVFKDGGPVRGICTLVLNFFMCIMAFGHLSSQKHGLDRVAMKHVAVSFRFAILVTLLLSDLVVSMYQVHLENNDLHPTDIVARAFAQLFFCLCILTDCSPQLPPSIQFFISVNAHIVAHLRVFLLNISAGWMVDLLRILGHLFGSSTYFLWP
jgi:hypothetical protein